MKISKLTGLSLFVAASLFMTSCGGGDKTTTDKPQTDTTATTQNDTATQVGRVNYAFGVLLAKSFTEQLGVSALDVKVEEIVNNVKSVLEGTMSNEKIQEATAFANGEAMRLMEAKKAGKRSELDPKMSAAAGVLFGNDMKMRGVSKKSFNVEEFTSGIKDVLDGKSKMDMQGAKMIVEQQMAGKNLEAGKKFLAENLKKNPKLKTTASGIQYEIMKEGNGPKPSAADNVTTHYHGTLTDGTIFDSSVDRKTPIDFPVNGVIKGWQEILQLMPKGSKWRVFIPSNLAYGEQGPPNIGPNSALIFEMELLKINGK